MYTATILGRYCTLSGAEMPKGVAVRLVSLQGAEDTIFRTYRYNHGEAKLITSAKKAEANRQNALKSTGPKTPEVKDAVRLNAVKHGLLSEQVLLPGEDEDALRGGDSDGTL
jgi:hypothetical protein